MTNTIANAAALISEVEPIWAEMFVADPFTRPTIVEGVVEVLRERNSPHAERVSEVLHRVLALEGEKAVAADALHRAVAAYNDVLDTCMPASMIAPSELAEYQAKERAALQAVTDARAAYAAID